MRHLFFNEIGNYIGGSAIWIIADKRSHRCGLCISHLICGKMSIEPLIRISLPSEISKKLLRNSLTIPCVICGLTNDMFCEKVLALISNSVPYMIKATKSLKVFYPNLIFMASLNKSGKPVKNKSFLRLTFFSEVCTNAKKMYKDVLSPDIPLRQEPVFKR